MGWIFRKPKYEKLKLIDQTDLNQDPGTTFILLFQQDNIKRERLMDGSTINSGQVPAQILCLIKSIHGIHTTNDHKWICLRK